MKIRLVSSLKNVINCFKKNPSSNMAKTATNLVTKSNAQKELFCHKYWADALEKGLIKNNGNRNSVSLHSELHGINHHFIHSPYPEHMDMPFMNTKLTPREMIFQSDFEFKSLKPLEEKLTAYRCIGEKPQFFSDYPLYKKRLQIKKGDIVDMKEYAYATSDLSYAKVYLPNNRGILYELEIPEKARVSVIGSGTKNEIVCPRSSKWECLDVQRIVNDMDDYYKVKLRYLLPQDSWRK